MTTRLRHIAKFKKVWVIAVFLLAGSCNDFLDEVPDNRVDLDNLEKAQQLLTNAYSVASYAFTEWMSDNVSFTIGTNIRLSHEEMYEWEDVTTGPTELDTPDFYWIQTYNAIAHANEVLAVLDDLPVDSEEDQQRKDAIEAEALLTRAYGHFMLVNLFSQHISPQTNSDDGVPYIEEPETTFIGTYERESIRRTYNNIEDDLEDGLKLVNDNFFANSGKYHFNSNAALAFASRYYLFRGDFSRCLSISTDMLGSNPGTFVRDLLSDEYKNASSSITAYPQVYTSPDEAANLMLMRKISLVQRTDFAYGPEQDFYRSLFATNPFSDVTDERQDPALVKGQDGTFPLRFQSLFERSSLNSNVGTPYHIAIAFSGEEVLLNRAEANAALNNLDEALADLQTLSDKRYSGGSVVLTMDLLRRFFGATNDPSFTDQLILFNYIILERRKEFIGQGLRWFDIKRFSLPVTHNLAGGGTVRLERDDDRKALQIPQSAVDVGGLEPNPR